MQPDDNAEAGDTPLLKPDVKQVLKAAACGQLWVKGTMARTHAWALAEAASRGWLTTEEEPLVFGTSWRLTASGNVAMRMALGF